MELSLTCCDFDKTIYAGNSPIDFYFFCLRRNWHLFKYLFKNSLDYIKYKLHIIDHDILNERYYSFLRHLENIDELVEAFWDDKIRKIKDFFWELDRDTMLILTASAGFLIRPLQERLGIAHCIATEIDPFTGELMTPSCEKCEKLTRLYDYMPDAVIDEFYSDSRKDAPLASIARRAFKVKKNNIKPWKRTRKTEK